MLMMPPRLLFVIFAKDYNYMSLQNVLFLARWYPNRYDPMPGLFIHRHAAAVARLLPVSLLYVMPAQETQNIKKAEIYLEVIDNVFVCRIYYPRITSCIPLLSDFLKLGKFYYYLWKGYGQICKSFGKPSLIHVNVLTRIGVFAILIKIIWSIPYVVTEHWSRYLAISNAYKGLLRKIITKIIVQQAKCITTVSHNLANAMKAHNLHNMNYVRVNNVVLDSFFKLSEAPSNNIPVIIHVSCFENRSKNISGLLRTLGRLKEQKTGFHAIMVGDGEDFDSMKSLSDNYGLKDKDIEFTGLLEGPELISAMAGADFMVMFSNYENMPVVISEAMAMGMPVVATSVGGIPEHINDFRGRLVHPGDEQGLLQTLTYMCEHHKDFDRKSIQKYAQHEFSFESVGNEFLKIYNSL